MNFGAFRLKTAQRPKQLSKWHSFSALASRRRSFASSILAAVVVARQAALASLHELLRPHVIQALRIPLLGAQLGDAVVATSALQHDPNLVFGREMPPGRPVDVLHYLLGRLLSA